MFAQIDVTDSSGEPVVVVRGEVDLASAGELRSAVERQTERQPARLVVDLTEVSFLDSSGLGAIASGLKLQRAHGGTVLVRGAAPHVRRVFEISGLGALLID